MGRRTKPINGLCLNGRDQKERETVEQCTTALPTLVQTLFTYLQESLLHHRIGLRENTARKKISTERKLSLAQVISWENTKDVFEGLMPPRKTPQAMKGPMKKTPSWARAKKASSRKYISPHWMDQLHCCGENVQWRCSFYVLTTPTQQSSREVPTP